MSKRILLTKNMIDHIHFQKDSVVPERFAVTIDVKSMKELKVLQSQILKENEEYPTLVQIKKRSIYTAFRIPHLMCKEIIRDSKNHTICYIEIICKDMDGHKIKLKKYSLCD